jgi:hypothetical protein
MTFSPWYLHFDFAWAVDSQPQYLGGSPLWLYQVRFPEMWAIWNEKKWNFIFAWKVEPRDVEAPEGCRWLRAGDADAGVGGKQAPAPPSVTGEFRSGGGSIAAGVSLASGMGTLRIVRISTT